MHSKHLSFYFTGQFIPLFGCIYSLFFYLLFNLYSLPENKGFSNASVWEMRASNDLSKHSTWIIRKLKEKNGWLIGVSYPQVSIYFRWFIGGRLCPSKCIAIVGRWYHHKNDQLQPPTLLGNKLGFFSPAISWQRHGLWWKTMKTKKTKTHLVSTINTSKNSWTEFVSWIPWYTWDYSITSTNYHGYHDTYVYSRYLLLQDYVNVHELHLTCRNPAIYCSD